MQQLPCGCRRVGRRNCIEPNCPRESEVSRNDLFFCPVARERNLHRTGEPELCAVELPAASYTQIVCTGRCAKHRKEMEDNLQREKRREQKEKERRRRELEQEREREERERKRVSDLGLIREGVVETGNGNGSGMDANELLHLNAVLDARERARNTKDFEVERAVEVVRESGLGWVDEGLKTLTLDEEREKKVVVEEEQEKGEEKEKEEEEQVVKWNYRTKEDREKRYKEKNKEERERMERARKRYTGINALGKVKAATAMLEEIVAKEWDEDARDGNEGMAEARRVSKALRRHGNETNPELSSVMANRSVPGNSMPRPAGDRPAGGEARRVSGPLRRHGNESDPNMNSAVVDPSSRSVSGNSVIQHGLSAGGAYEDVDDEVNKRVDEAGGNLYDLD